jgi:hypothetical protein
MEKRRALTRQPVELTATDINALIAANRKSRGTASVGINDTKSCRRSSPFRWKDWLTISNAFGLNDHYLNATVTIVAPPERTRTACN